jgi:general transcription factor 3C polypeptide 3 (transcription factor C subunit 4)
VRHDQYIAQTWSSLASCYDELGKEEAARQMRFFAASVDRDGDKWAGLAADGQSREGG